MTRSKIIEVMARHLARRLFGTDLDRPDRPYIKRSAEDTCQRIAEEALAALSAEGMAVVPVEPTEAMLEAGRREIFADVKMADASEAWAAMLAAAAKPQE